MNTFRKFPVDGTVRFNGYQYNFESRRLWPDGEEPRKLGEQEAAVLKILLERYPDSVARADISEKVWPGEKKPENGESMYYWEHKINVLMSRLHERLGDSARNPVYFEKSKNPVGYRWIADPETGTSPTLPREKLLISDEPPVEQVELAPPTKMRDPNESATEAAAGSTTQAVGEVKVPWVSSLGKWSARLSILVILALCALANDYVGNALLGHNQEWTADFDKQGDPWMLSSNSTLDRDRLIVPASNWAFPRRWDKTPLNDFWLQFRLAFKDTDTTPGLKAEWILRSKVPQDPSRMSTLSDVAGYHFQLIKKENGSLIIRGFVVGEPGRSEPLEGPNDEHSLGMTVCCDRDEYLRVNAVIIGKRIIHCRTLQSYSTTPTSNEVAVNFWDRGFVDVKGTIMLGGLVLASGNNTAIYSGIAVSPPPADDLARCFFSGQFCLPMEPPPCV